MINLRADNRVLVNNAKWAYIVNNYQSNTAVVEVSNTEPFSATNPILIGEMGQNDAEVMKINAINGMNITLSDSNNIPTSTTYSHPESTKMVTLPYDQIRFFWTAVTGTITDENPVFDQNTPLTSWEALDPSSFYSTFGDTAHATGFGWFQYRNSTTGEVSNNSNPIPYAGFSMNTASQLFLDFDSLLNTNELKLVSTNDKFSWLNEGLAIFKNKLNLTNSEYTVSVPTTVTTIQGTAEYLLPDDFADIVEITDNEGLPVGYVPVSQVMSNNGSLPQTVKYYIRGRYFGLTPTPTGTGNVYHFTYRSKSSRITSLSTYIDLPDNGFYCLKDWMMYRAYMKFNNPLATAYYQSFKNFIDLYMQSSVKRNANLDTWEVAASANT